MAIGDEHMLVEIRIVPLQIGCHEHRLAIAHDAQDERDAAIEIHSMSNDAHHVDVVVGVTLRAGVYVCGGRGGVHA